MSAGGTVLIFDDYDFPNLHPLWDRYVRDYDLKQVFTVYPSPHHDLKYVKRAV